MAKRKGKSRQRIKDWQQRYNADENFQHTDALRERFTRRKVKLPDRQLDAGSENLTDLPRVEGLVTGHFPGGVSIHVDGKEMLCQIAGTFRPPEGSTALTVGDIVTVALTRPQHVAESQTDRNRSDGMVIDRQQRKTALSRPEPRSQKRREDYDDEIFEKVIVANMDCLLIVAATCQPPLRHGLIDRFLIIAERGKLRPLLVINKIDLAKPDKKILADFKDLGLETILCSAETGKGLRSLKRSLKGQRSVLAGASGVGKTTLINAIIPGISAATREVRAKDNRGRHTTRSAIIYELPQGGILVDTPGIRELGVQLKTEELPWYFPEFEAVANDCKFRNCTHTHEPDCAVVDAVEAGDIPERRYVGYLNILDTLEQKRR